DVPVTMENDGKCGVLAEVWKGNLKDCTDGAVIILGTAVAGGIVKDRKVHKGKRFTAGELSFALVGIEDDMRSTAYYRCGVSPLLFNACMKKGIDVRKLPNHGLIEFPFIEDQKTFSEWNDRPEYAHGMNGLQFFELLEQGDPDITELYQQYLKDLARLVLNIQIFFDPDKILIGGGISRQERLVPDIRAALADLQEKVIMGYRFDTVIDVCYFMNEANQYGALYHFLEKKKQEESGK
ncbi:MAG: ROK family protein, partial [Lachnospiraceae bacterium]|nr:ROK family protein [Lachnospiraceae bacterium]